MTAIKFGRFSDGFKPKEKIDKWTECDNAFAEKNYTTAYLSFMEYLKDDQLQNVNYSFDGKKVTFELLQGSKILRGTIDLTTQAIEAEATVAKLDKKSVAALRKLLEMNFKLNYSRFALRDDDSVCIKFDSNVLGGHPRKLYYAFKEVANRADKQDDLLTADFAGTLSIVDNGHVINLPEHEKEVKYTYLMKWINEFLARVPELESKDLDGAVAYLVLNIIYKIDFLLRPEGKIMDDIERMSSMYWSNGDKSTREKNREIIAVLKEIIARDKPSIIRDFYQVTTTFAIARPANHENDVAASINGTNPNHEWYKTNNYPDVAIATVEYGLSYCAFMYGLPQVTKDWIALMYQVLEPQFFADLGFTDNLYDTNTQVFNVPGMMTKVYQIQEATKAYYPYISFNAANLKFTSVLDFLLSYTNEITTLNYNKSF